MFLEDQVWPKKCGHMDGKQVVPTEEWLAKLTTVMKSRSEIFLTARTDARAVNGLKDALELLEKQQLQVIATGKGKVVGQSILPGTPVQRRQTVYLNLANPIE